jgi:hypothetical protein
LIGQSAFTDVARQLRYSFDGPDTLVGADVNGDGAADLAIRLTGHISLTAGDFML